MSAILFVDSLSLSRIHFEEKGVLRIILVKTKLQNNFKNSH